MDEATAESIDALNAQLVTLDDAGVPLGLGPRRRWRGAADELLRLIAGGRPAREAIDYPSFDSAPAYRRFIRLWTAGVPLERALASLHEEAAAARTVDRRLTRGLAYPVAVAVLACVGVAVMSQTVLPVVEAQFDDLRRPVGPGVETLRWLRRTTPIWLVVTPVACVALILLVRRLRPPRIAPGSRHVGPTARRRLARSGRDAAALLEAGAPREEALAALAEPIERPPLLAWASDAGAGAGVFRTVSDAYDELARRGATAFATWTPLAAVIVIGGGATLAYALTLFVPVIELLWTLSY